MSEYQILAGIIVFLYILYDTDFLTEYLSIFSFLKKKCKIEEYQEFKGKSPILLNYFEFLNFKNKNFFTSLLSCSICLSVWIVALVNILCNFGYINIGCEIIIVWIGYPLLKFILKKLYE